MKLKGKVALVTGGGAGIGRGVAERLAAEGAKVAVIGIDVGGYAAALTLADELKNKGSKAIAVEADVTKMDQVQDMIARVVETFGRLDIVVNCAGVISSAAVQKLTEGEWETIMDVNATGTFIVDRIAAAQMIKQGFGKIINLSSVAGKIGLAEITRYCASKFAIVGFTKSLAAELAKTNITVNAVCPGIVDTQMWEKLRKDFGMMGESEEERCKRNASAMMTQRESSAADDIVETVIFLAGSNHVTGQAIYVDGKTGSRPLKKSIRGEKKSHQSSEQPCSRRGPMAPGNSLIAVDAAKGG